MEKHNLSVHESNLKEKKKMEKSSLYKNNLWLSITITPVNQIFFHLGFGKAAG